MQAPDYRHTDLALAGADCDRDMAAILAIQYADTEPFASCERDPRVREQALTGFFLGVFAETRAAGGELLTLTDRCAVVLSAPCPPPAATPAVRGAAFAPCGLEDLARGLRRRRKQAMGNRAHVYLGYRGQLPGTEKQGLSFLIRRRLERADEDRLPVYTEAYGAQEAARLEKYGFGRVAGPAPAGGAGRAPVIVAMLRAPRRPDIATVRQSAPISR